MDLELNSIYIVDENLRVSKIKVLEITEHTFLIQNLDDGTSFRIYKNYFYSKYKIKEQIKIEKSIEELKTLINELLSRI
jgi:hypothetical protein